MKFIYLKEIDSTQKYLIKLLKNELIKPPICIWSENQTNGIGSKGNSWLNSKGNLFFSFCKKETIPIHTISLYYAYKLKVVLEELGQEVLIKWPNDLYTKDLKKVGGVMSNLVGENIVVGIGLNSKKTPKKSFGCLDIEIKNDKIIEHFFKKEISFEKFISGYKKEFLKTKDIFKIDGYLDDDGALIQNNKRIYSRR